MSRLHRLIFIGCIILASIGPTVADAAPRIQCDAPAMDFGVVNNNTQSLTHTFIIRNSGDADLQIQGVVSSCGCTTTKVGDSTVKPGAETSIKANFSLQSRKGPQRKDIRVTSNDPLTPQLVLQLACDIRLDIDTDMSCFIFNRVADTQTISKTVTLRAASNVTFKITSVDTSAAPSVSVAVTTVVPERTYAITATVRGGELPSGRVDEVITVCTDNPSYKAISLPVSLYKVEEATINPGELLLLDTALKEPEIKRDIYLRIEGTNRWEFFDVEPVGDFNVTILERASGKCRVLLSNLSGVDDAGTLRLAFTLRCISTGAERRQEVKLRRYVPQRRPAAGRAHTTNTFTSGKFRETRKTGGDASSPRQ